MALKAKRGRPAGSKTQFAGIKRDAAALRVSAGHLWKVLTNQRESHGLVDRYKKLKAAQPQSSQTNP